MFEEKKERILIISCDEKRRYDLLLVRCLYDAWWLQDGYLFRRIMWLIAHTKWQMPDAKSPQSVELLSPIYTAGELALKEKTDPIVCLPSQTETMLETHMPLYKYLCRQLADAQSNQTYHLDKASDRETLSRLLDFDLEYISRLESLRNRFRPADRNGRIYVSAKYDDALDDLVTAFKDFRDRTLTVIRALSNNG